VPKCFGRVEHLYNVNYLYILQKKELGNKQAGAEVSVSGIVNEFYLCVMGFVVFMCKSGRKLNHDSFSIWELENWWVDR